MRKINVSWRRYLLMCFEEFWALYRINENREKLSFFNPCFEICFSYYDSSCFGISYSYCFRMVLFIVLVYDLEFLILLAYGWFCLICYFLFRHFLFYLLTDGSVLFIILWFGISYFICLRMVFLFMIVLFLEFLILLAYGWFFF